MRLVRLFLALMLALGASLPACAGSQGCEPAAAAASHHHAAASHRAASAPAAPHDKADRHADACIGCAAELPDALALTAPMLPIAAIPIAALEAALSGLSPGVSARPPRPRA